MNRYILALLLIVLIVSIIEPSFSIRSSVEGNSYSLEFTIEPSIEYYMDKSVLTLPNLPSNVYYVYSYGGPAIPLIRMIILTPYGRHYSRVYVELGNPYKLKLSKPLLHLPKPFPLCMQYSSSCSVDNSLVSSKWAGGPWNYSIDYGLWRGVEYLVLSINPIKYIDDYNVLIYSSIRVYVEYTKAPVYKPFDQTIYSFLKKQSVNKDMVSTLSIKPVNSTWILIITRPQFLNILNKYVDLRRRQGYQVIVKTVEDIIDSGVSGRDIPEKIRNYIHSLYNQSNGALKYLLIVGDVSGNAGWPSGPDDIADLYPWEVPTRYFYNPDGTSGYSHTGDYTPSDWYYAALDTNWDGDGDEVYGEIGDGEDWAPELAVGRIPLRTPGYLNDYLEAIVSYNRTSIDRMLGAGAILVYFNENGKGDYGNQGDTSIEAIWSKLGGQGLLANTVLDRLYEHYPVMTKITSPSQINGNISYSNMTNAIYSLKPDIVLWYAHGGRFSASRKIWSSDDGDGVPEDAEMDWEVFIDTYSLTSEYGYVNGLVFAMSCLTAYFDYYNYWSLGEKYVNTTALWYIGWSRVTWGYKYTWTSQIDPDKWGGLADGYPYTFLKYLTNTSGNTCGDIGFSLVYTKWWSSTKEDTDDQSFRKVWWASTLLGDPVQPIHRANTFINVPEAIDADIYGSVAINARLIYRVNNPLPNRTLHLIDVSKKDVRIAIVGDYDEGDIRLYGELYHILHDEEGYNNIYSYPDWTELYGNLTNGMDYNLVILNMLSSDPGANGILNLLRELDKKNIPLLVLDQAYQYDTGGYYFYKYCANISSSGYPAPEGYEYEYPYYTYVEIDILDNTHPIFYGVSSDPFLAGQNGYIDYRAYTSFLGPSVLELAHLYDTYYSQDGMAIVEWQDDDGEKWIFMGVGAVGGWVEYLDSGDDGQWSEDLKTVLKNAVEYLILSKPLLTRIAIVGDYDDGSPSLYGEIYRVVSNETTYTSIEVYSNWSQLYNDLVSGENFSLVILNRWGYDPGASSALDFIEKLDEMNIPLLVLDQGYRSTGGYYFYKYRENISNAGYPAPEDYVQGWPEYWYVYVIVNESSHYIFEGLSNNTFLAGDSGYTNYRAYTGFLGPPVAEIAHLYDYDSLKNGICIAEWTASGGERWLFMSIGSSELYMEYYDLGDGYGSGKWSIDVKTILKNAIDYLIQSKPLLLVSSNTTSDVGYALFNLQLSDQGVYDYIVRYYGSYSYMPYSSSVRVYVSPKPSGHWFRLFNTSSSGYGYSVCVSKGFIYGVGVFEESGLAKSYIVKLDRNGSIVWFKTIDYSYDIIVEDIVYHRDMLYIVGTLYNPDNSLWNGFIAKLDLNGDMKWFIIVDDVNNLTNIVAIGNYLYALGYTEYYGTGCDIVLIKTLLNGFINWSLVLDFNVYDLLLNYSRSISYYGNYLYLTWSTMRTTRDILVTKIDFEGNVVWSKVFTGSRDDYPLSIVAGDRVVYVVGYSNSFSSSYDALIICIEDNGLYHWSRALGEAGDDYGVDAIIAPDNHLYVVGYTSSYGVGETDLFIAKYTFSGDCLWMETIGSSGVETLTSTTLTPDQYVAFTGYTDSYSPGSNSSFILLYSPNMSDQLDWVSVNSEPVYVTSYDIVASSNVSLSPSSIVLDSQSISLTVSTVAIDTESYSIDTSTARDINLPTPIEEPVTPVLVIALVVISIALALIIRKLGKK